MTPSDHDGPLTDLVRDAALDESTRQKMLQHFASVPLHRLLGIALVELGRTRAVFSMPIRESAFNSSGNLHGGSIATLIDVAAGTTAALASGFKPGEQTLVTADLHVRYLARPRGDVVYASGDVLRAGRQLIVVDARVTDEEDRLIAVADFSSMIVPRRAPLKPSTPQGTGPDL